MKTHLRVSAVHFETCLYGLFGGLHLRHFRHFGRDEAPAVEKIVFTSFKHWPVLEMAIHLIFVAVKSSGAR